MDNAQVEKMLKALLMHEGLIQHCDGWALGSNDGGRYVALYHSRANFRLIAVYEEVWQKLPAFITDNVEDESPGDPGNNREKVESKGRLNACPLFAFTRYAVGKGDDLRWKFGDVLWVKGEATRQQAADRPHPPKNGNGHVQPQQAKQKNGNGDLCPHCHAPSGKPHGTGCPHAPVPPDRRDGNGAPQKPQPEQQAANSAGNEGPDLCPHCHAPDGKPHTKSCPMRTGEQPQAQPQPPADEEADFYAPEGVNPKDGQDGPFGNRTAELRWAVEQDAFPSMKEAHAAYMDLYWHLNPESAEEMAALWTEAVQEKNPWAERKEMAA